MIAAPPLIETEFNVTLWHLVLFAFLFTTLVMLILFWGNE
jgi:hypothetical protein